MRIFSLIMCILICMSCTAENKEPLVFVKIPIAVQSNGTVQLHLKKLVGDHPVGIRCQPEIWMALTNSQNQMAVQVNAIGNQPAKVFGIEPGLTRTTCDQVH